VGRQTEHELVLRLTLTMDTMRPAAMFRAPDALYGSNSDTGIRRAICRGIINSFFDGTVRCSFMAGRCPPADETSVHSKQHVVILLQRFLDVT
jgi:hypothetical protein